LRTLGIVGGSPQRRARAVARLVALLSARGLAVSVIRRAREGYDADRPGKDSFRHRAAGAGEVIVASAARWTLLHENEREAEPDPAAVLARMAPVDLVLLDGFAGPGAHLDVGELDDPEAALARAGWDA
jgi:molybdopterin-guanine dinucleotide biosynthesis adapter protein